MRLTGELVGDVAENNWHDLMDEYGVREYARYGYSQLPQEGYDWEAIAKELNDMLGPGTCQQEEGGWSTEGDHARVWLTCGHDCMVETVADLPNFCPECGAKVVTE